MFISLAVHCVVTISLAVHCVVTISLAVHCVVTISLAVRCVYQSGDTVEQVPHRILVHDDRSRHKQEAVSGQVVIKLLFTLSVFACIAIFCFDNDESLRISVSRSHLLNNTPTQS